MMNFGRHKTLSFRPLHSVRRQLDNKTCEPWHKLVSPLQGNLKTVNNKKIAAWNFSRKGEKAQRFLTH